MLSEKFQNLLTSSYHYVLVSRHCPSIKEFLSISHCHLVHIRFPYWLVSAGFFFVGVVGVETAA